MKKLLIVCTLIFLVIRAYPQKKIRDESVTYQQERMVFKQWDRGKFTPKSGFLGLNPYYWLTWGLHPNYPKTDLRPLSATGPQSQRLGAVAGMQQIDKDYEKQSDTLAQTSNLQIASMSGLLSATDPLWLLYYSKQLKGVIDFNQDVVLATVPQNAREKIIASGALDWYSREIGMLSERLDATRSTTLERGARILSYHRILAEYRRLSALWADKVLTAQREPNKTKIRQGLIKQEVKIDNWTPESDVKIAREILQNRKY
ncbi:hypothetical protein [Pedobacter sp. MW01-1-1]|uniref:hypothetical protein n=1 Tax=Pedobacter sp. MW01-1-1 TaxID=3383027 RepID=UPI003FF05F99